MPRKSVLAALLLLLPAAPAIAELMPDADLGQRRHPNRQHIPSTTSHGFVYENPQLQETIHAFNGSLSLNLPIGFAYPLSSQSDYAFSLRYHSNIWDFGHSAHSSGSTPSRFALADPLANAGLGWSLSFGQLLPPGSTYNPSADWLYVDPAGDVHAFYETLYDGLPDDDPGGSVFYTRDGSFLRLNLATPGAARIDFRNGASQVFEPGAEAWSLAESQDAFGNLLSFQYLPSLTVIADEHGREHRIHFRPGSLDGAAELVDRIELAAFGGTTASYQLHYAEEPVQRSCHDNAPETPSTATVSQLTAVDLPDGSQYRLEYHGNTAGCRSAGRLAAVTLPTGGRQEYVYRDYRLKDAWCDPPQQAYLQNPVGVWKRILRELDGTELGTWLYAPKAFGEGGAPADACVNNLFLRTVETTPLDHRTELYFSLATRADGVAPIGFVDALSTYGLPMRLGYADNSRPELLQTRKTFDCPGTCKLLEYAVSSYTHDGSCSPADLDCADTHRRQIAERTYAADDDYRYLEVDFSDYDGLGHFRQTTRRDTYGEGQAGVRQQTIAYNPDGGSFPGSFIMPSIHSPWVLDTFDSRRLEDATGSVVTEFCFDSSTGAMERKRQRASASGQAQHDIVAVFSTVGGNVVEEKYFGSNVQALPAENKGGVGFELCSLALPSQEQSRVSRTFSFGALSTERFLKADGQAMPFTVADRSIDANTGLVSASRDSAGLETLFERDALGRITWRRPQAGHGAFVETVSIPASQGTAASRARRHIAQADGEVLQEVVEQLDGFGRRARKSRRMPSSSGTGNAWSVELTRHDADGRMVAVSEPHAQGETPVFTEIVRHDALGRPLGITNPDGTSSETIYIGRREQIVREHWAAYQIAGIGAQYARLERKTVFDAHGRTVRNQSTRFFEPGESSPPEVHVIDNSLDVFGHITSQIENGLPKGPERVYDGRGLLVLETQPVGSSVLPRSRFEYDARGRLVGVRQGAIDLSWEFDRADRELRVYESNDPSAVWSETVYDGDTGCVGCAGQPVRRVRFNRYPAGSALVSGGLLTVTEELEYAGVGGRVSERRVELRDGGLIPAVHRFDESRTYTELGQLESLRYPYCQACNGDQRGPDRRLDYSYDQRRLTAIDGSEDGQSQEWLRSATYHPGGLAHQKRFGNGVFATTERDPLWPGRAGQVIVDYSFYRDFDSGDIEYDGMGRVVRTGEDWIVPNYGERRQAFSPPPVGTLTELCFVDPFGAALSTREQSDCTSAGGGAVLAYDPDGREILRHSPGEQRYSLYGAGGNLLREWVRGAHDWSHTLDFVHQGRDPFVEVKVDAQGVGSMLFEHGISPPSNRTGAMLYQGPSQNTRSPFADPWTESVLTQKSGSGCTEAGVPCPENLNYVGGCTVASLYDNRLGCDLYRDYRGEVVTIGGTESVDSCRVDCMACCNVYGSTSPQQIEAMNDVCDVLAGFAGGIGFVQALLDAGIEIGEALLEAEDTPFMLEIVTDTCSALVDGLYAPSSKAECRRQCDERFRSDDSCRNLTQPIPRAATPGGGPPVWGPEDCLRWRHSGDERRGGANWECVEPALSVPAEADIHCFLQERCGRRRSELTGEKPKRRSYWCEVRNAEPVEDPGDDGGDDGGDEDPPRGGGRGKGPFRQTPPPDDPGGSGGGGGGGGGALPFGSGGPHGFPGSPQDPCRIYGGCGTGF